MQLSIRYFNINYNHTIYVFINQHRATISGYLTKSFNCNNYNSFNQISVWLSYKYNTRDKCYDDMACLSHVYKQKLYSII